MSNLFDPEEEYFNLLNRHSEERHQLDRENLNVLHDIILKYRSEMRRKGLAAKSLSLLINKQMQEEIEQRNLHENKICSLLHEQSESVERFLNIVYQTYPGYMIR